MKRIVLFAFAFAWLAACDTPSAPTSQPSTIDPPSFAKISNEKFPISGLLFNSCPPEELLAFEGSFHVLVTGETTPTTADLKIHTNTQGIEGIGLTSGDRYSVIQNTKDDFELSADGSFEEEFDIRFRLIRQGSDDNFWLRVTLRITFPPFEVEVIREEVECRG
jgi:hypothetical protein